MTDAPTPPPVPAWVADQPPPPAPPPPPTNIPAGWYADPWSQAEWRWWDGYQWLAYTQSTSTAAQRGLTPSGVKGSDPRKPRLPAWLSPPVLVAAFPSLALVIFAGIAVPLSVVLGIVPFLIVAPVLVLMDRIEPEPTSQRLHAFLWGAFVAGTISLIVNTIVALASGSEALTAVASAPIIEEITKTGAIVWAVRRKLVDGIMDALTYAGWSALGFAIIEDINYFFIADEEELLLEVFIGRALLTPFAHPLFTAWAGLAIGIAVRNRKPLVTAWWGLLMAMATHAAWNGSLAVMEAGELGQLIAVFAVLGFILLFFGTAIAVIVMWRRDRARLLALAPQISARYGVPLDRVTQLLNPGSRRAARKQVPSGQRKSFDLEAGTLVRLGHYLDSPAPPSPADESRLLGQLASARNGV